MVTASPIASNMVRSFSSDCLNSSCIRWRSVMSLTTFMNPVTFPSLSNSMLPAASTSYSLPSLSTNLYCTINPGAVSSDLARSPTALARSSSAMKSKAFLPMTSSLRLYPVMRSAASFISVILPSRSTTTTASIMDANIKRSFSSDPRNASSMRLRSVASLITPMKPLALPVLSRNMAAVISASNSVPSPLVNLASHIPVVSPPARLAVTAFENLSRSLSTIRSNPTRPMSFSLLS